MQQSLDAWAGRVGSCAAVLMLLFSGLSTKANQLEPWGVKPVTESFPSLTDADVVPVAPQPSLPPLLSGDLWSPPKLTGDWAGARSEFAENGLTLLGDITQYYQGVTKGGLAQRFNYGGRADYLVDFDTQKLGLWEGGHFDLRGETRIGQDCNAIDGAFAPSNFAMALPLPNQNVTALTGVQYTQDLSERVSVFLGKLNLLDGTPTSYARGMRLNYFWNTAMQMNLSRSYLIPSTLGVGFTVRDDVEPVFSFYLLDTHYTPTTSGFPTLFTNGVVAYGEYRMRTNRFGLPGHRTVGFLYSTATRTAIDADPYLILTSILAGTPPPTESSAWTATYRFDQVIYANAADPKRNWTLHSDLGLTDGSPNPIRWFANVSLVGNSPIRGREDDTIGVGYYHLGTSNVSVLTIHGVGAEDGVEIFYNAVITPWFHITPDLQVLDPAQSHTPTALLVGVRARLSF